MMLFLREPQLSNYVLDYEGSEKAHGPSTNNNTKSTINSWKQNYPFSWDPFRLLKVQLSAAPDSIKFDHSCILLEDMMLLEKGKEQNIPHLKRSQNAQEENVEPEIPKTNYGLSFSNLLKPRAFKNEMHFECDVTMVSNVNRDNFAQSIFVEEDFKKIVHQSVGLVSCSR